MNLKQMTLENESLIDFRVKESVGIIENAVRKSGLVPLIVNFSGGKDSMLLLDLVQKVTDNFLCCYMVSGIEFREAIKFAEKSCRGFGRKLLFSYPSYYKGDFFERLNDLGYWPTIKKTWCNRDLKIRPQKKMLNKQLGKCRFFKLNGVRRYESRRRTKMHKNTPKSGFMLPDYNVSQDIMVFPILNWKSQTIKDYLESEGIAIKQSPLYKEYGVSGCFWCPFYQRSIYEKILRKNPNLYDKFIEWEEKLGQPSANGFVWLREVKRLVGGEG